MDAVRRLVLVIAGLNLAYFFVEFIAAVAIGSVALFADSVDFLEDAFVNALVFFAVVWTATRRRAVGLFLAIVILVPGVAAFATAVWKMFNPETPEPFTLTSVAVGALIVNLLCAVLLARHREGSDNLVRAAWLSARNDSISSVLIIVAGVLTLVVGTAWWDIVAGLIIAFINVTAAKEVWETARDAKTQPCGC